MAFLQIHYVPPSLGEPINKAFKSERELLTKVAEVLATLLIEDCDFRVSENGHDLSLRMHIELVRNSVEEPVVIKL